MTDTRIQGSGNSRSIKSVPNLATLAPTYDKLLELLTGEGLPVDIGGLNDAGLAVHGTDLNKATLLKDATAALYGKGPTATPDDILAAIRPLITTAQSTANGRAIVQYGSYTGTGKYGAENPNSLSFSFNPSLIFMLSDVEQNTSYGCNWVVDVNDLTTDFVAAKGFAYARYNYSYAKKSGNGSTVYWYHTQDALSQCNQRNKIYNYFAIG